MGIMRKENDVKLSEKMLARAERMRKRGHRAYAMFLRNDAREVAELESQIKTLSKVIIEDHDWTQEQIDFLLSP